MSTILSSFFFIQVTSPCGLKTVYFFAHKKSHKKELENINFLLLLAFFSCFMCSNMRAYTERGFSETKKDGGSLRLKCYKQLYILFLKNGRRLRKKFIFFILFFLQFFVVESDCMRARKTYQKQHFFSSVKSLRRGNSRAVSVELCNFSSYNCR